MRVSAPMMLQQTGGLFGQQAAVGALAQRSVEQQDARRMIHASAGFKLSVIGAPQQVWAQRRQVVGIGKRMQAHTGSTLTK